MNFEPLKKFMDLWVHEFTPGCCISVYKNNKEIFKYASGYSDLDNGIRLTGNELFFLYSCSKVVTVTAALQLYEKGVFLLDDPLYEYIPEYKNMTIADKNGNISSAKNYITMRHLFTMTAGLTYNKNTEGFNNAYKLTNGKMNTMDVVRSIAVDPLSFEPGTHWQYSLCHDILAGVVEVVTGKRFRDYVKENIFEPLDMNDSYYHLPEDKYNRLSEQYFFEPNTGENDIVKLQMSNQKADGCIRKIGKSVNLIFGNEYDSGGAGIISNPGDYIKFIAALANMGVGLNGERILSSGAVELMRTNQLSSELLKDYTWPDLRGYGYGLGVRTMIDCAASGSLGSTGEFGWNGAAGSMTLADPEQNLAMVFGQHIINPRAAFFVPRLRNILYSCIK